MTDLFNLPTGRELRTPAMAIRVLPRASGKTLERARKTWPEANAADFEVEGKLFRDKGSGIVYRRVQGDPQLGGAGREDVSTFFISHDGELGDGIVYLTPADNPGSVTHTFIGEVGGYEASGHEALVR